MVGVHGLSGYLEILGVSTLHLFLVIGIEYGHY